MLLTRSSLACLLVIISTIMQQIIAETATNGVRASNILGGLQQHASFSFVRPGLTQTAFAFNGPSSHQSFSGSVGDPHLAHRVQPSLAHALAYRNPGLGFVAYGNGPIPTTYATGSAPTSTNVVYQQQQQQQQQVDYLQQQALALAYQQQLQQQQYQQYYQQPQQYYQQPQQQAYSGFEQPIDTANQQQQQQQQQQQVNLAQLYTTRLASQQQSKSTLETVPEQIQLQQQQQQQQEQSSANLLGVAYSAAPSVAHVKVNGNGYKFDF